MKLWISILTLFGALTVARADGPELYQHWWRSNGVIYASVHIPACHVARFERVVILAGTNWAESALSAMTVDEEVFGRIVVFSESLSNFQMAFYRVHILRVLTCGDLSAWTHACF